MNRADLLRCCLRAVLVVAALLASGCLPTLEPGTTDQPAELNLRLRLRQSCGFDTAQYDTSCLAAIVVVVRKSGNEVSRHCKVLDSRPANIQRVLFDDAPQLTFGSLTSEDVVTFEVVGLHDRNLAGQAEAGVEDLCGGLDDDFSNWLFFGESGPLDLGQLQALDAGVIEHEIPVDCRDCESGCTQLGQPICPTNPISFCVPGSANLTCEKPCESDEQCFEGALTCDLDDDRCDQSSAAVGRFCQPCQSDDDCQQAEGWFCVGLPGEQSGVCAQRCPQNRCATGTKCNRLGNRLRRVGIE